MAELECVSLDYLYHHDRQERRFRNQIYYENNCRTALRTCPVPNPGGYGDSAEQGNHAAEELDEFTDVEKEGSFEGNIIEC